MAPWLRFVLAFVVFCHGFIYARIGSILPTVKGWTGHSWLLSDAVTGQQLRNLIVAIHVIAGVLILASALAIGFAPSVPGWWRPLAMVGSVVGIIAFFVFWDGQTNLLIQEGFIGVVVSAALLVAAIAFR